ncbi:MAG: hypothetical protein JSR44_15760 [Spirochaetes bacterium]|nr:hypothetical protein [Spirochaetota bacterium]
MESAQLKNIETLLVELTRQVQNRAPSPSPTADVILSIVPMVAVVFGSVLVFFMLLYNYKLRREKIRQQIPTASALEHLRFISLLAGCLSCSAGIPLTLFFIFTNPANPGILGGLIPLSAGVGLIVFFYLSLRRDNLAGEHDRK